MLPGAPPNGVLTVPTDALIPQGQDNFVLVVKDDKADRRKVTLGLRNDANVEVTEGLLIENWTDTVSRMEELVAMGLRFSIDDFGTGYSSLSYLRKLPLSQLKIDRSFVNAVDTGGQAAALCRALLSMAEACGLGTVAEGVETASQQATLREMGYRLGQGYLWSKPLAAKDALAWLATREAGSRA